MKDHMEVIEGLRAVGLMRPWAHYRRLDRALEVPPGDPLKDLIKALYGLDHLGDLVDKSLMAWLWGDSLVLALEDLPEDPLDLGASEHIHIWTFGGLVYVSWWWDQ